MLRLACAVMLAASLSPGCADDDKFPSDFKSNQTLDEIGESGLGRICSTFEAWVRDQYSSSHWVRMACTADAVRDNQTASACADQLDACIDDVPASIESLVIEIQTQAGCDAVDVSATGCTSTVGQIEACLDSLGDALDRVELELTCAAAGEPLADTWWRIETPASCTSIETTCE